VCERDVTPWGGANRHDEANNLKNDESGIDRTTFPRPLTTSFDTGIFVGFTHEKRCRRSGKGAPPFTYR
jgi:hypothetical protein